MEDVHTVTGGDVAAVVAQRTVAAGSVTALNASVKNVLIGKVCAMTRHALHYFAAQSVITCKLNPWQRCAFVPSPHPIGSVHTLSNCDASQTHRCPIEGAGQRAEPRKLSCLTGGLGAVLEVSKEVEGVGEVVIREGKGAGLRVQQWELACLDRLW